MFFWTESVGTSIIIKSGICGTGTEMKKKTAWMITLFLLAGITGCKTEEAASSGEGSAEAVPELLEPVDVKMDVAKAQIGDIYRISVYKGEVIPYTEELHFLVDGSLESIFVTTGEMVQEGQVLAALSEERLKERIENLEDELDSLVRQGEFDDRLAEADIEIAREELAIMRELGDFGPTSRVKELEIQEMELELAQARELRNLELEKVRTSLEEQQKKVGKNEIIAPFGGRIIYVREGRKGDAIQGYTPVFYIADESRLSLRTEYISESAVKNAYRVCAKIGDKEFDISYIPYDKSELLQMALTGEEMQANFCVDAEEGVLCAGQFGVVMLYQSCKKDVLTIPINALYRDGSGQYVYKQVNGTRTRCNVKTGMTTDTKAEIVEGLEEGDLVYVKD